MNTRNIIGSHRDDEVVVAEEVEDTFKVDIVATV